MGVAAARRALGALDNTTPDALWFSTVAPAYLDKTNATVIHAALRLDSTIPALDFGGAQRSAVGALRAALTAPGRTLVVASDIRTGLTTGPEDGGGGDAATAVLTGSSGEGPLLAAYPGGGPATGVSTDTWRTPGSTQ